MNDFNSALERAMRRQDAPEGFTDRVMARAGKAPGPFKAPGQKTGQGAPRFWDGTRIWAGGSLAAVVLLGVFLGGQDYRRHERRVAAEREFEVSARITDKALERARHQLRAAGVNLED